MIPPLLRVEDVTLQYETGQRLIRAAYRVSFDVLRSDRFVILGPSGCGKSTILKAVGGYIPPVEGRVLLNGTVVSAPGPDRVFVFQEFDQLLPWKTVRDNIVFALTARIVNATASPMLFRMRARSPTRARKPARNCPSVSVFVSASLFSNELSIARAIAAACVGFAICA